jgi:hypothetical protein
MLFVFWTIFKLIPFLLFSFLPSFLTSHPVLCDALYFVVDYFMALEIIVITPALCSASSRDSSDYSLMFNA